MPTEDRADAAAARIRAASDAELRAMVEHLARLTGPRPKASARPPQ